MSTHDSRIVDVALVTVGGGTRVRSISVLKPGGILVSIVSSPLPKELAEKAGVRAVFFYAYVTTVRLNAITSLFEGNKPVPRVDTVLPLVDAQVAHPMLAGLPHERGKIVLTV
jgi:NADPH:quinone reductase-like Zn-dependent oxidoreductase